MLIVARATDQLSTTCKTSAILLVLYGIVVGNYELSGEWTLYTTIVGLLIMTLGIGAIGTKLGLKKAMQMGSWGCDLFRHHRHTYLDFYGSKKLSAFRDLLMAMAKNSAALQHLPWHFSL